MENLTGFKKFITDNYYRVKEITTKHKKEFKRNEFIQNLSLGKTLDLLINFTDLSLRDFRRLQLNVNTWLENYVLNDNSDAKLIISSNKSVVISFGWGNSKESVRLNENFFKTYKQFANEQIYTTRLNEMQERYKLERTKEPDEWLITDTENLVTITFIEGKFNETQKIVPLEDFDPNDFMKVARILREIGDYLAVNYPELI